MSKKFSFKEASEFDSASESLPNTARLNKLYERLKGPLKDIELEKQLREKDNELKKQLREELKQQLYDKGSFDDNMAIRKQLDIKARDYQELLREIVKEVDEIKNKEKRKRSASLQDKTFTKKDIETIIQSLGKKIEKKKRELVGLPYFDQYSKRADTLKKINTFETNIKELQNYMRHDFKDQTLKETEASIPKHNNFISDGKTTTLNRTRKNLNTVLRTLEPYVRGGTRRSKTRRSKMHRSKTRRSKTRRSKTRKKSKKSITK